MARRELSKVAVDHLANKWDARNKALEEIRRLQAFVDEIDEEVQQAMGEFEQATIRGVPVVNYAWKEAYAWARFVEAHPHIARQYMVPVTRDELDKKQLVMVHRGLLQEFQTREFRPVTRRAR